MSKDVLGVNCVGTQVKHGKECNTIILGDVINWIILQALGERGNWDAPSYMHAINKNGSIEMNDSCMHGHNAIL